VFYLDEKPKKVRHNGEEIQPQTTFPEGSDSAGSATMTRKDLDKEWKPDEETQPVLWKRKHDKHNNARTHFRRAD
jgi:hypothetical protein